MVYENMVTSVRNQTAYLIYNPWARGMVAEHHVDFEGALDLSVADSASNNGYCLVPGSDPQQGTIAFNLADVTIRYSAYQQLLPVAFQVCAEPQALCQGAAATMGYGGYWYKDDSDGFCHWSNYQRDYLASSGPLASGCLGSTSGDGSYCVSAPESSFDLCVSSKLDGNVAILSRPAGSVATLSNEANSEARGVCGQGRPTGICQAMREFTATRVDELDWASSSYTAWLCGFEASWNDASNPAPSAGASQDLLASIDQVVSIMMPPNQTWTCQLNSSTAMCPTMADLTGLNWNDPLVYDSWDATHDLDASPCRASSSCTGNGELGSAPCQMRCMLTNPMQAGVTAPLIPCPGKPLLRCPNAADLAMLHTWTPELRAAWDAGPVEQGQSYTCKSPIDCTEETGAPCNMHCVNPWNPLQPLNEVDVDTLQSQGTPGQTLSNIVQGALMGNPTRTHYMQGFGWRIGVQRLPNGPLLRTKYFQTRAFNNLVKYCGRGSSSCSSRHVLLCGDDCKNQRTFFSEGCCGDKDCAAEGAPASIEEGGRCWPNAIPSACSAGLVCKPWSKGFQNLWGCCKDDGAGHCSLPAPSIIEKGMCVDTAEHGTVIALQSPNKDVTLRLQAEDGNIVLYRKYPYLTPQGMVYRDFADWAVGACGGSTSNPKMCMQVDGNLVVYRDGCEPWTATVKTFRAAYLSLQDDGNLVAYQASMTIMGAHVPPIAIDNSQYGDSMAEAVWSSFDCYRAGQNDGCLASGYCAIHTNGPFQCATGRIADWEECPLKVDSTCLSGKCGRYTEGSAYHCCATGVASGWPGDWCKDLENGHECKHDNQCISGHCGRYTEDSAYHCCANGFASGWPGSWCRGLPAGHECKHNNQCNSDNCNGGRC